MVGFCSFCHLLFFVAFISGFLPAVPCFVLFFNIFYLFKLHVYRFVIPGLTVLSIIHIHNYLPLSLVV